MGGIQGIQLDFGGGPVFGGGNDEVNGGFSFTGGISVGLGGDIGSMMANSVRFVDPDSAKVGFDLVQMPINFNVSRWADETWHVGGEIGLRLDLFITNFDLLCKVGGVVGEGSSFGLAPTAKIGFYKDLFGIEASVMAYSDHENVGPGRAYIGAYLNVGWFFSIFALGMNVVRTQENKMRDERSSFGSFDNSFTQPGAGWASIGEVQPPVFEPSYAPAPTPEPVAESQGAPGVMDFTADDPVDPLGDHTMPDLLVALRHSDPEVVARAKEELNGTPFQKLFRNLKRALSHEDPIVRAEAARAFGSMGKYARNVTPKLATMLGDDDVEVKKTVLQALLALGDTAKPAVPALAKILRSEDANARVAAVFVLGKLGKKARGAMPALKRALNDSDERVRRMAASAIESI